MLVTGLEQAAASRFDTPRAERRPCYTYIDEFQDFAANPGSVKSLAQILSECRKFGLHLTLAHQNLSQLTPRMLGAIGNIQTRVIFGVARRDAEWFAREVGQVDVGAIKHAVQTETQYPLFAPLAKQWENWTIRLQHQSTRQVLVAGADGSLAGIWTMPIPSYTVTNEGVERFRVTVDATMIVQCLLIGMVRQNFEITGGPVIDHRASSDSRIFLTKTLFRLLVLELLLTGLNRNFQVILDGRKWASPTFVVRTIGIVGHVEVHPDTAIRQWFNFQITPCPI